MKIYLSKRTAGRYGGQLNGNLKYLDRVIQQGLDDAGFTSSFDDLWLVLSYPPMYTLPGVIGIEKDYQVYYDKFPYCQINRRSKKIDITLKAPEFSEHFDKEEQEKYAYKLDIENQFKNLGEVQLGKILIGKFLEAGAMIRPKLRKEDIFDLEIFNHVLGQIKLKIEPDFLQTITVAQQQEVAEEAEKTGIRRREQRRQQNKPKNKLIRDLRVYCNGLPPKAFYPYVYQYKEIFLNLLARGKLMCPGYHHLYIQAATTPGEAIKNSLAVEGLYTDGIAVVDYDRYVTLPENEKDKWVFNIILEGLRDIASLDKLDISIIENVALKIQEKGLNTELVFREIQHSRYILTITYFSKSMEEQCPVYFNLVDRLNGNSGRIQIGKASQDQLSLWLQKIAITKNSIKIKSSGSIRGQVWLEGKPTAMEFSIAEILG